MNKQYLKAKSYCVYKCSEAPRSVQEGFPKGKNMDFVSISVVYSRACAKA